MEKKLPKGWVETELREVVWSSKGKKPKRLEEYDFEGALPYLDIFALEKGIVRQYADINSSKVFNTNDIAIVWDGARSGWIFKTRKGVIGSTLCAISPTGFSKNFLYYYLLKEHQGLNSNARGVGIPHVDPTYLWNLKLSLPPLPEQERIANKLDELFGRIEVIKASMEKIPQLLKDFRQQVLTSAVTGKLTEEWREGRELEEWKEEKLENLINSIDAGKSFESPNYPVSGNNVGIVKISAVTWGEFDENETKTVLDSEKINSKLFIRKNDFLISRANTIDLIGNPVIVKEITHKIMLSDKVWRVNFKIEFTKYFVKLFLQSKGGRKKIEVRATGNQSSMRNISQSNFKNIDLLLPPLAEQKEIVKRVESLFAKADRIEEQYKRLKGKIDVLPQLLLHKAFKGELVEQLPTDGDAADLLKEIMALKKDVKKKK
ncbi:MAG: restriction endonuclease subunit S [Flavobacterium sp.]